MARRDIVQTLSHMRPSDEEVSCVSKMVGLSLLLLLLLILLRFHEIRALLTEVRLVKNEYIYIGSCPSLYSMQATEEPKAQDLDTLIDTIQMHLKDHSCKDNLRETFQIYDKEESGFVDKEVFFKVCDTLNIPVDDSLIKEVSMNGWFGLTAQTKHWSFLLRGYKNQISHSVLRTGFSTPQHQLPFQIVAAGCLLSWGWEQIAEKLLVQRVSDGG